MMRHSIAVLLMIGGFTTVQAQEQAPTPDPAVVALQEKIAVLERTLVVLSQQQAQAKPTPPPPTPRERRESYKQLCASLGLTFSGVSVTLTPATVASVQCKP